MQIRKGSSDEISQQHNNTSQENTSLDQNKAFYDSEDLKKIAQILSQYLAPLEQDEQISEDTQIEREAIDALMNKVENVANNAFLPNEDIMQLSRSPDEHETYVNALKNSTRLQELVGGVDKVFESIGRVFQENSTQGDVSISTMRF